MLDIIGSIGGLLYPCFFFFCYVPQIKRTFITKDVNGLSYKMFLLSLLGYISSFIYQFKIGFNSGMTANAISGAACCILLMVMIKKYRKK